MGGGGGVKEGSLSALGSSFIPLGKGRLEPWGPGVRRPVNGGGANMGQSSLVPEVVVTQVCPGCRLQWGQEARLKDGIRSTRPVHLPGTGMDGGACGGRLGRALAKGRDMEVGQWVPGLSPHDALGQLGTRPGYKDGTKNRHSPLEGLSSPANAAYAGLIPGLG